MATLNKFIISILLVYVLILISLQPTQISQKDVPLDEDEVYAAAILLAEAEPTLSLNDAKTIVGQAYASAKSLKSKRIQWLSCSDSDNGKDFNRAGKAKVRYSYNKRKYTKEFSDECQDNENLLEYYCRGKRYSSTFTKCDYGCDNGACKQAPSDQDFFASKGFILSGKRWENILKDYKEPKIKGYIIEFKEKPLVELKVEAEKNLGVLDLKEEIKNIEGGRATASSLEIDELRSEVYSKEIKIKSELDKHEEKIKSLHERVKSDILGITRQSPSYSQIDAPSVVANTQRGRVLGEYSKAFSGIAMDISAEDTGKVKKLDYVKAIYPNNELVLLLMDSVPLIGADAVWKLDSNGNKCIESGGECLTGKGINIAVIDTGVDYTHPDLGSCTTQQFLNKQCNKVIGGYDFFDNDPDPIDDHGHGTHVAATAAGNGILKGVAPDSKIYAFKASGNSFEGLVKFEHSVMLALEKIAEINLNNDKGDDIHVVTMSMADPVSEPNSYSPMSKAFNNIVDLGVVATIAGGNYGPGGSFFCRGDINDGSSNSICNPASAVKVITVAASDKSDKITDFSSRGPVEWGKNIVAKPDIAAHGHSICAALMPGSPLDDPTRQKCFDNKHILLSGTSMATPHVAGVAALVRQAHPEWKPSLIKAAIKNSAKDLGAKYSEQGAGRVNALGAVQQKTLALVEEILQTSQTIDIYGTAIGEAYMITLKETSSGQIMDACTSTNSVQNNILCSIDKKTLKDTIYEVILEVHSGDNKVTDFGLFRKSSVAITQPTGFKEYENPFEPREIFSKWGEIPFIGIAGGEGFSNYEMKWCKATIVGEDTGECGTEGMVLENNGQLEISNSKIASWSVPSNLETGLYYIKLIVHYNDGSEVEEKTLIYVDMEIKNGWPQTLNPLVKGTLSLERHAEQPTLSDIDNDGDMEILFTYLNNLVAYNSDGTILKTWNLNIDTNYLCDVSDYAPAVGDINNDNKKEIVLSDSCGYVHIVDLSGGYLSNWPRDLVKMDDADKDLKVSFSAPMLYDVNNDGKIDIIMVDYKGNVHAFDVDENGNYLPLWSFNTASIGITLPNTDSLFGALTSIAVGDFDKDGKAEIAIAYNAGSQTSLMVLSADGRVLSGWPKMTGGNFLAPIIADINGDSYPEIVAINNENKILYIFKSDGTVMITAQLKPYHYFPFSVGNINNDEKLEIVFSGVDELSSCIFSYNYEGKEIEGWPICLPSGGSIAGLITIADIIGDSYPELITVPVQIHDKYNLFEHLIVDTAAKQLRRLYSDGVSLTRSSPMADLDNNGKIDVISLTWSGKIYVHEFDNVQKSILEWPQYNHDDQNTRNYHFGEKQIKMHEACQIIANKIGSSLGTSCGNTSYDYIADVSKDKTIDNFDLTLVQENANNEIWCATTYLLSRNICDEPIHSACQQLLDTIKASYGASCGNAKYNYVADVNSDTKINSLDWNMALYRKNDGTWCATTYLLAKNPCV